MIAKLLIKDHIINNVECDTWENLITISGEPLIKKGLIKPQYLKAVKGGVEKYGPYMVLIDDIVFFHARPQDGVNKMCLSLVLLTSPVFILEKRIKAAFMFAATNSTEHIQVMQELAKLLVDDEFLNLLREIQNTDEILKKLGDV